MISTHHKDQAEGREAVLFPGKEDKSGSSEKFQIQSRRQSCLSRGNNNWLGDNGVLGVTEFDPPDIHDSIDDIFERAAERGGNQIVMDKRTYGGAPCIAGTRVPVYAVLELVEAGYSHRKILKSFPTIGQQELAAALQFATHVMEK